MILRPLPLMWAAAAVLTAYGFIRDPGPVPAQTPIISGVPFVVDGDTIVVNEIHIRLFGIDAPESAQICSDQDGDDYRCGLLATSLLEEEIAGRSVDCTPIDTDHYGRTVAICAVGNIDLGRFMVERGLAVDENDSVEGFYDAAGRYAAAQIEAKSAKRGIWAGWCEPPAKWRREHQP